MSILTLTFLLACGRMYKNGKGGEAMEGLGCSFTGHRIIDRNHTEAIGALLTRAVEYAYSEGCRIFYTGGAMGFDTIAAREVIRFRISHPDVSLVLLLPCIDQNANWSDAAVSAYEYVLSMANEVRYISDEYTDNCMRERNRALVDACDMLIAYVGRGRSGSGQTLRMAEAAGKKVYNLYPTLERAGKG